ncbi:MAG: extracellular solute-binding protein [Planctomycetota bacterium]|nr:extracellular solute-binding protein [Planctomycetota bacterium]
MKRLFLLLPVVAIVVVAIVLLNAGQNGNTQEVVIFHAAGITPFIEAVRDKCRNELGIELVAESSGSQVAVRKVTELGRDCDLAILADRGLVELMMRSSTDWRLDFALDEVVLGVGSKARYIDEAQQNWPDVFEHDDVRLGRVDEDQGPIGYRTLLVWKLAGKYFSNEGLYNTLDAHCEKVVDHVTLLTPLLKNGELDYAFVYRSICIAQDIRFIELADEINLGDIDTDYSLASVSFRKGSTGGETVTVSAEPICWTLTAPSNRPISDSTAAFLRFLLTEGRNVLSASGFKVLEKPALYGNGSEDFIAVSSVLEGIAEKSGTIDFEKD